MIAQRRYFTNKVPSILMTNWRKFASQSFEKIQILLVLTWGTSGGKKIRHWNDIFDKHIESHYLPELLFKSVKILMCLLPQGIHYLKFGYI